MKRWIALLLAMLMLLTAAGCQSSEKKHDREDDDDRSAEEDRDTDQDDEDGYEIVVTDNSIRNENGDILVRRSYQKVVLLGDDPVYEIINQQIEADCEDFLSSGDYWTEEELEESIAFNGLGYDSFYNMASAEVVENGNGVLRIRISVDWFMGGVTDSHSYELVFDLETGEAISGTAPAEDGEEESLQDVGVPFDVVLVDNSIRNHNGDILVRRTYEQVVLQGDDPAIAAVNALIEADCEAFLADNEYMTVEDYEEIIEWGGYGYDTFLGTASVTVTHNAGGIFSFQIATEHFQGGVYNVNFYGHTYDLTNGGEANLADLLGMPEDEALAMLNEMSLQYLVDHYGEGLIVDPEEALAEYTLDRYDFFVSDGELVLCFATYEFACGAAGPTTFYTGIFID